MLVVLGDKASSLCRWRPWRGDLKYRLTRNRQWGSARPLLPDVPPVADTLCHRLADDFGGVMDAEGVGSVARIANSIALTPLLQPQVLLVGIPGAGRALLRDHGHVCAQKDRVGCRRDSRAFGDFRPGNALSCRR